MRDQQLWMSCFKLHSVSLQPLLDSGLEILWSKLQQDLPCQRQMSEAKSESDNAIEVTPITCGADTTISAERTGESMLFFFFFFFDDHEEQRIPSLPLEKSAVLQVRSPRNSSLCPT